MSHRKKMKLKRLLYLTISGLASLAVLAGCEKEEGKVIHKKSASSIRVNLIDVSTKSSVVDNEELNRLGNFVLDAYLDADYYDYETDPPTFYGSNRWYVKGNGVSNVYKMGTKWELKMNGEDVPWVSGLNTRFFSYWPSASDLRFASRSITNNASNPDSDCLNFTYSLNGSGANDDADRMDDIIFAYNKVNFSMGMNEAIDIKFYHALSQVRFCVDLGDATYDRNLIIKRITLQGLKNGGSCSFDGTQANAEDKFVWNTSSAAVTSYKQGYNANFKSSVPSGWSRGAASSGDPKYNVLTNTNVFFVVPQTLNGAKVIIVFEDGGVEYEREVTLDNDTYQAGNYYTYKISASDLGRDISLTVSLIDWNNYDDKLFI